MPARLAASEMVTPTQSSERARAMCSSAAVPQDRSHIRCRETVLRAHLLMRETARLVRPVCSCFTDPAEGVSVMGCCVARCGRFLPASPSSVTRGRPRRCRTAPRMPMRSDTAVFCGGCRLLCAPQTRGSTLKARRAIRCVPQACGLRPAHPRARPRVHPARACAGSASLHLRRLAVLPGLLRAARRRCARPPFVVNRACPFRPPPCPSARLPPAALQHVHHERPSPPRQRPRRVP
jgi:hypothetical protein